MFWGSTYENLGLAAPSRPDMQVSRGAAHGGNPLATDKIGADDVLFLFAILLRQDLTV